MEIAQFVKMEINSDLTCLWTDGYLLNKFISYILSDEQIYTMSLR